MFRALPLPALIIDASYTITFANQACERLHKDYESIIGRSFSGLFPDKKLQTKALYLFEETFNARQPRTEEAEMRIHDRRIWARMNFRSVRMNDDRAALVLIEDLTHERTLLKKEREHSDLLHQQIIERHAAEKSLQESQEKLTLAIKGGDISLWDWDIATGSLVTDARLSEMLGYRPGEIKGRRGSWGELMPREDAETFAEAVKSLMRGSLDFLDIEHRLRTKSGGWKWVITRGKVAERNEQGNPIRALGTILDITEHKKNQERIRALTRDLIRAQEDERRKIALDLHDDVAQQLAGIAFLLHPLTSDLASYEPDAGRQIARVYELIEQTVESVRSMSHELRPHALDRDGLVRAIRMHCADFAARNGIRVEFLPPGMEEAQFDFETKINLFRVVQEALNNVKKHSGANAVRIRLQASPPNIALSIQDNGRGFPVREAFATAVSRRKMGLVGMEQRASLLGGRLSIKSVSGKGSLISIEVPWKRDKHERKKKNPDR